MRKQPRSVTIQYLIPQRALSWMFGLLAECRVPWIKNWCINKFINRYQVDMKQAQEENPLKYENFKKFFIRALKPGLRPIDQTENAIISPVDGEISQLGAISQNRLIQAKGREFNLESLLADKNLAQKFIDGSFITLYLSPRDYHRVHLPCDGQLQKMIYVPGNLFSVNQVTAEYVPNLFARNERLICLFETQFGPMAVIFVGAMIVRSMATVWHGIVAPGKFSVCDYPPGLHQYHKGDEIGLFNLGSTVILLFGHNQVHWLNDLKPGDTVKLGQIMANAITS